MAASNDGDDRRAAPTGSQTVPHGSRPGVRDAPTCAVAGDGALDAAVALDHVVAELAEDQVVARAAGDVVVAEAADAGRAAVEREGVQRGVVDRVLGPPRDAPSGSR